MADSTLTQVVNLVQQLSPHERTVVRAILDRLMGTDATERAIQRAQNQAALDLLATFQAEDATHPDVSDSWWEPFVQAIEADRLAERRRFTPDAEAS